jgi:hypothetical protein
VYAETPGIGATILPVRAIRAMEVLKLSQRPFKLRPGWRWNSGELRNSSQAQKLGWGRTSPD